MKFTKSILLTLTISLISLFGFTACNSGADTTGQFQVNLTDAPADYDEVNVNIESVEVRRGDENGDETWITIMDDPMTVNLLNLSNGNEITLGSQELATGRYTQIRLILGSGNNLVIDGQNYSLQTPSAQQTGIKLNIDADIQNGESYTLLLDFDAGQSVVKKGTGDYLLKPVLHAVELSETGSISGSVSPSDFQTYVLATNSEDTLSSYTNDQGDFEISALAPGTYDVTFQPENDNYQDTTVTDVNVNSGEDNDIGSITLNQ